MRVSLFLLFAFATAVGVRAAGPRLVPLQAPVQGQRAEFRIDEAPTTANNFDPDQIAIDAEITGPSGDRHTVPAFWFRDYQRKQVNGAEQVEPDGDAHWRLRILPLETGPHHVTLTVRQGNEAATSTESTLEVLPGNPAKFVRIAPNRRDLETTDGAPLKLLGANYCWPGAQGTFAYDRMFNRIQQVGGNFARLWLAPWWAGIEHKPGTLTRYPLDEAWRLDHVFQQAEGNGIYLLLCFDHHGMYQQVNKNWGGQNNFWPTNPYSVEQGGPCASPNDFFVNQQARHTYQKRLRYLIARYGYSPSLLAWQFFNEIDNTFIQGIKGDDVLAWHQIMARFLKIQDPYKHLVTTSMTGGSDQPSFWKLPEMDFSMYHSYADPAPARTLNDLAGHFVQSYGKPFMVGEFGVDGRSWNIAMDPHLRGFRQQLWASATGGSVGSGMSWWWDEFEGDGAYPLFATFSKLMTLGGWQHGDWHPAAPAVPVGLAPDDLLPADPTADIVTIPVALNIGRRLPLRGTAALPHVLAGERASEFISAFIYGTKNPDLPQTLTLRVNVADKARLVFRVNSVASDNQLLVRVGSNEVFRTGFANVDNQAQMNREIDREFAVNLPSGLQTVEIANVGTDWTGLESLRIERALVSAYPKGWSFEPEPSILREKDRAILYVVSPHTVFPASAFRFRAPLVSGKAIQLTDWPAGRFELSWYSPIDGTRMGGGVVTTAQGKLSLALPDFDDDVVGLVSPVP